MWELSRVGKTQNRHFLFRLKFGRRFTYHKMMPSGGVGKCSTLFSGVEVAG